MLQKLIVIGVAVAALFGVGAQAGPVERCTSAPPTRLCAYELGEIRVRTRAPVAGDVTEAEIVAPAHYASRIELADAALALMARLMPESSAAERGRLLKRIAELGGYSSRYTRLRDRYQWRMIRRDGRVRIEAHRVHR